MGRRSTGAITTGEVIRIELSYLLKNGYIKKGKYILGSLTWTNGSSIHFESHLETHIPYIRLAYQNTDSYSGEITKQDYKIYLTTIPSNLSRGQIYYFICPITGRRCRILYKCYGSLIWKSRFAYRHRIYYHTQVCSKYDYHNTRYWNLTRELETLYKRGKKSHYRGKDTRLIYRIDQLEARLNYHDNMRWLIIPQSIQKMVFSMGIQNVKDLF